MKLPLEKEALDRFEGLLGKRRLHRMRVNSKVCRDVGGKVLHPGLTEERKTSILLWFLLVGTRLVAVCMMFR